MPVFCSPGAEFQFLAGNTSTINPVVRLLSLHLAPRTQEPVLQMCPADGSQVFFEESFFVPPTQK